MTIRLSVTGRSYHAAEALPDELALPEESSVDDALEHLAGLLPADAGLPETCLVAVSGAHLGTLANHSARQLRDGDELLIIAPVAGG